MNKNLSSFINIRVGFFVLSLFLFIVFVLQDLWWLIIGQTILIDFMIVDYLVSTYRKEPKSYERSIEKPRLQP